VFERFSDDARRVVVYAQEECRLLRHVHIGTEHLLLALLYEADNATGQALQAAGATSVAARQRLEQSHGRGKKEPHGHIPFTPRAKRVLEESLRVAQRLGQDHIDRPHLLRGMLEVPDCAGVQLLVDLGVDLDALARRADELAAASEPAVSPDVGRAFGMVGSMRVGRRPARQVPPEALARALDELALQRDRLERGLRRYGRHDEDCDREHGCTCGLDGLLGTAEPGAEDQ
jgi:ATP-dependent Clp protease ATP-binding subunit ClpA